MPAAAYSASSSSSSSSAAPPASNDWKALAEAGMAFHRASQLEKANEHLALALQHAPQHSSADAEAVKELKKNLAMVKVDLGTRLKLAGQVDVGLALYLEAIQICSTYAPAYFNLAVIHSEKTQYDQALKCYQLAVQHNPNYVEALCIEAHTNVWVQAGELESSAPQFVSIRGDRITREHRLRDECGNAVALTEAPRLIPLQPLFRIEHHPCLKSPSSLSSSSSSTPPSFSTSASPLSLYRVSDRHLVSVLWIADTHQLFHDRSASLSRLSYWLLSSEHKFVQHEILYHWTPEEAALLTAVCDDNLSSSSQQCAVDLIEKILSKLFGLLYDDDEQLLCHRGQLLDVCVVSLCEQLKETPELSHLLAGLQLQDAGAEDASLCDIAAEESAQALRFRIGSLCYLACRLVIEREEGVGTVVALSIAAPNHRFLLAPSSLLPCSSSADHPLLSFPLPPSSPSPSTSAICAADEASTSLGGSCLTHNCNIGVIYKNSGQLATAIDYYERALKVNPNFLVASTNLAIALTDRGTAVKNEGRLDEGIMLYKRALHHNSKYAAAWYNLGVGYAEKQRFDDAKLCYEMCVSFDSKCAEAMNNLGVIYKDRGNLDCAINFYHEALVANPTFSQTLNNLSVIYTMLGKLDEAYEYCISGESQVTLLCGLTRAITQCGVKENTAIASLRTQPSSTVDLLQDAIAQEENAVDRMRADEHAHAIVLARTRVLFDQGVKPCVQLTLSDHRSLICTPDHRIFAFDTRSGLSSWLPAHSLDFAHHRVWVCATVPREDVAQLESQHQSLLRINQNDQASDCFKETLHPSSCSLSGSCARVIGRVIASLLSTQVAHSAADEKSATSPLHISFTQLLDAQAFAEDCKEILRVAGSEIEPHSFLPVAVSPSAPARASSASCWLVDLSSTDCYFLQRMLQLVQADPERVLVDLLQSCSNGIDGEALDSSSRVFQRELLSSLLGLWFEAPELNEKACGWSDARIECPSDAIRSLLISHFTRELELKIEIHFSPSLEGKRLMLLLHPSAFASFARLLGSRFSSLETMRLSVAVAHLESAAAMSATEFVHQSAASDLFVPLSLSSSISTSSPSPAPAAAALRGFHLPLISRADAGLHATYDLSVPGTHAFYASSFAAHNCSRAIKSNPQYAEALNNLGVLYRDEGRIEEAIATYAECLKVDPSSKNAAQNRLLALNSLTRLEPLMAPAQQRLLGAQGIIHLPPASIMTSSSSSPSSSTTSSRPHIQQLLPAATHSPSSTASTASNSSVAPISPTPSPTDSVSPSNASSPTSSSSSSSPASSSDCKTYTLEQLLNPTAPVTGPIQLQLYPTTPERDQALLDAVFEAHRSWGSAFSAAHEKERFTEWPECKPQKDRLLRIGYLSADFFIHSVSYFMEAPLMHRDRSKYHVTLYSNVSRRDKKTELFESLADTWRSIYEKSARDVANQMRRDRLDILIECTGHTAGNRLDVCALKPAPIIVTWIGYPNTTGLKEIDYRLTDGVVDPLQTQQQFTEKLIRFKGPFLCYSPPSEAPPVSETPAVKNGYITFGSFNSLAKMNDTVLATWCALLRAVPTARLLIKCKPFASATVQAKMHAKFASQGIPASRVELVALLPSTGEHLGAYSMVDISVDTFPYSGTTTTCEALYSGVPVVTYCRPKATAHAHSVGATLISRLGVEYVNKFVASSPEEYVSKAVALASDLPRLKRIRSQLRSALTKSSLCDGPALTRELESNLRRIWTEWCKK